MYKLDRIIQPVKDIICTHGMYFLDRVYKDPFIEDEPSAEENGEQLDARLEELDASISHLLSLFQKAERSAPMGITKLEPNTKGKYEKLKSSAVANSCGLLNVHIEGLDESVSHLLSLFQKAESTATATLAVLNKNAKVPSENDTPSSVGANCELLSSRLDKLDASLSHLLSLFQEAGHSTSSALPAGKQRQTPQSGRSEPPGVATNCELLSTRFDQLDASMSHLLTLFEQAELNAPAAMTAGTPFKGLQTGQSGKLSPAMDKVSTESSSAVCNLLEQFDKSLSHLLSCFEEAADIPHTNKSSVVESGMQFKRLQIDQTKRTYLVVQANPNNPPISALLFCNYLSRAGYGVSLHSYVHSSVSSIPQKLSKFLKSFHRPPDRDCSVIVRIVWTSACPDCTTFTDAKSLPIHGEALLLLQLVFATCPATYAEASELVMLIDSLKNGSPPTGILQRLASHSYFTQTSCDLPGVQDFFLYVTVKSLKLFNSLPKKLSDWMKSCSRHEIFSTGDAVF